MSPFERMFHFRQITIIMNFVAVLSVGIKRVDCSNLKWSIAGSTCDIEAITKTRLYKYIENFISKN